MVQGRTLVLLDAGMPERPNGLALGANGLVPSKVQILFPALNIFKNIRKGFFKATKSINSSRLEKLSVFLDLFPALNIFKRNLIFQESWLFPQDFSFCCRNKPSCLFLLMKLCFFQEVHLPDKKNHLRQE